MVAYSSRLAVLYWKTNLSDVQNARLPDFVLQAWHRGAMHLDRDGIVYHSSRGEIRVEWGDSILKVTGPEGSTELLPLKPEIFNSLFTVEEK